MKPLRSVTVEDLTSVPVWKYAGVDDSTATADPTERLSLSESERETFIALTEFFLASGARHLGFCSPVDDSGLDYVQPVIVTPEGHVRFWFEDPPSPADLSEQWKKLGARTEELFPVRFRCLVPVDGRKIEGTITHVQSSGGAA